MSVTRSATNAMDRPAGTKRRDNPESPHTGTPNRATELGWIDVCAIDDIPANCGVAALVAGRQVALVRTVAPARVDTTASDGDTGEGAGGASRIDRVFALSNYDPFSQAFVIARGIVGDRAGILKIASPIFKQNFDLETGVCLDDPSVTLPVYAVRVRDGRVEVESDSTRASARSTDPAGGSTTRPPAEPDATASPPRRRSRAA